MMPLPNRPLRMTGPLASRARPAFTLIELLVGLTISTLIVSAAAGLFVTTLRSWERGSRSHEILQLAQTTSDLIERHLRSAVPPSTTGYAVFWGLDLSNDMTRGHSLSFISTAPGRFPRSLPPTNASEIEFYLDPETGDGFAMRIDSSPDDEPDFGGYYARFSPLIQSFEVIYFDGTEWLEEWFANELPQAVEFTFTIADPEDVSPVTGEPRAYRVKRLVAMPLAPNLDEEVPFGQEPQ